MIQNCDAFTLISLQQYDVSLAFVLPFLKISFNLNLFILLDQTKSNKSNQATRFCLAIVA